MPSSYEEDNEPNPYRPAAPERFDPTSELSKRDRQILKNYLKYRDDPPSLLQFLPRLLLAWVLAGGMLAGVLIALALFAFATRSEVLAQFHLFAAILFGAFFGAVVSQIKWINQFISFWPRLRNYVDFDAIERDLYGGDTRTPVSTQIGQASLEENGS